MKKNKLQCKQHGFLLPSMHIKIVDWKVVSVSFKMALHFFVCSESQMGEFSEFLLFSPKNKNSLYCFHCMEKKL